MKKSFQLKNAAVLAGIFAASLFLAACGGKTLYLYNWTYYTPDSVIEKFEAEFDVKVVYDDYPTNEDMYTKLRGGASGYDIVIPSQDYVSIMKKQDMLEKIDHSKIPNLKYLRPEVIEKADYDPSLDYSVPYYWGAAGIAVNKTKLQDYERTWDIFSMDGIQGRACMLDDMREVIGDALSFLGYSVNTTDKAQLNEALAVVNGWKSNLAKFDADMYGKSFAEGEFWIVQGYPECIFSEYPASRRDEVDFFIPEAGISTVSCFALFAFRMRVSISAITSEICIVSSSFDASIFLVLGEISLRRILAAGIFAGGESMVKAFWLSFRQDRSHSNLIFPDHLTGNLLTSWLS